MKFYKNLENNISVDDEMSDQMMSDFEKNSFIK